MENQDSLRIEPCEGLNGSIAVPGDKSISHRAVLFGSIANGTSTIRGWLAAGDTLATLQAIRVLGITIEHDEENTLTLHGGTLHAPSAPLNLANAGTGLRLLAGILAGQRFSSILDGSEQLRKRPMGRITTPLRQMGANIEEDDGMPPLHIAPARLHGMTYALPVASAQVKSCLLLAALFANAPTTIIEPGPARDHTERMLAAMGAEISINDSAITVTPGSTLSPIDITVPGDFSSAAFALVAGSIIPNSQITLTNVNLNPTRTGLLDMLLAMGASITVTETGTAAGEPAGTIVIESATLQGIEISGPEVVRMIDEFPILMVAALCTEGQTIVRDAQELRVKETDRIAIMASELRKLGAVIEELDDGFIIDGPQSLQGTTVNAHDDHRVGMSLAIAGMIASGETIIDDASCIADSYPGFVVQFSKLGAMLSE